MSSPKSSGNHEHEYEGDAYEDTCEKDYVDSKSLSKPKGNMKHRGGHEKEEANLKKASAIARTVVDPCWTISENKREQMKQENGQQQMNDQVAYSLNKHKRWETDPETLLMDNQNSENPVVVVEKHTDRPVKAGQYGWGIKSDEVHSVMVYDKKKEMIRTGTVSGKGTSVKNVLHDKCYADVEKKEDIPEIATNRDATYIEYRFVRPSKDNQKVVLGPVAGKFTRRKAGKQRDRRVESWEIDPEILDDDTDLDEEEEEQLPRRDHKFSLSEYTEAQRVPNPHSRRQKNMTYVEEVSKKYPGTGDVDFKEYEKTRCQFHVLEFNTTKWSEEEFDSQLERLAQVHRVLWLDRERCRALMYPSLGFETRVAFPAWKEVAFVFEKYQNDKLRLIFNSTIIIDEFHFKKLDDTVGNPDLFRITNKLLDIMTSKPDIKLPTRRKVNGVYIKIARPKPLKSWMNYRAEVHSQEFTDTLTPFPFYQIQLDSAKEFVFVKKSDVVDAVETRASVEERKCSGCSRSEMEELFEMEDDWQCRDCLKLKIMHDIREKRFPLSVKFSPQKFVCEMDFMCAIVPVTLVFTYVKEVVIPALRSNLKLHQCPQCGSLSSVPEDSSLQYSACTCWQCDCTWCIKCGSEPHWPLNCEEKRQWKVKWMKQYRCENPEHEITSETQLLKFKCICNTVTKIYNDWTKGKCMGCKKPINPETVFCKSLEGRGDLNIDGDCGAQKCMRCKNYFWYKYTQCFPRNEKLKQPFNGKFIGIGNMQIQIKRDYSSFCVDARNRRINEGLQSHFAHKVLKLGNVAEDLQKLPDLRLTILHLTEYGIALFNLYKNGPLSLMEKLKKLFQKLKDFEDDVVRTENSELFDVSLLPTRIANLQLTLREVIDAFKQWE